MNNKNGIVTIVSVLLAIAILVIVGMYLYYSNEMSSLQSSNASLASKATAYDASQQKAAADDAAQRALFKVTSPSANSGFCYENEYSVSWQAPQQGMDIITAELVSPTSDINLGQFPATNNSVGSGVGYGSFNWDLTDANGNVVAPSKVYKLKLSGTYKGQPITAESDGLFSVSKCQL